MRNINITCSCYVNSVGIGNIAVIIYDEILNINIFTIWNFKSPICTVFYNKIIHRNIFAIFKIYRAAVLAWVCKTKLASVIFSHFNYIYIFWWCCVIFTCHRLKAEKMAVTFNFSAAFKWNVFAIFGIQNSFFAFVSLTCFISTKGWIFGNEKSNIG